MSTLSKLLEEQASAPTFGFDRFIVGSPARHRAELMTLLRGMIDADSPSTLRVILGPNGNGKTLILNSIREAASLGNLKGERAGFDVLFSRISIGDRSVSDLGLCLANELSRSTREPAETTFTLISAQILKNFTAHYRPPLYQRIIPGLARAMLHKAQKVYDDYAKAIVDLDEKDPVEIGLDRIEDEISKALTKRGMRNAFRRYADEHEMGSVLTRFLLLRGERALSQKALSEALRDELVTRKRGFHPKEAIHAIAAIAREVNCRVLLLMIDDCNSISGQDYVLQIAESLGEFDKPKLFLLTSGLESKWQERVRRDGDDQSFKQKVYIFGEPLRVDLPTDDELRELADNLVALVNSELNMQGQHVSWNQAEKDLALKQCSGQAYRVATLHLLREIRKNIR
jgi:hypothetical protein